MTTPIITPEERLAENRGVQHHDVDAHSPFGGSVATRVLRCPASVRLVEKVPAHLRKSSAYADRGTALHAAMALLIENECSLDEARRRDDRQLRSSRSTMSRTPCGRFSPMWKRSSTTRAPSIYLEHRVVFPTIAGAFGTCDLIVRIGSAVHVIDFKFGTGVRVLALYPDGDEDVVNAQLLFYAAAARHSMPEFFAGVDNIVLTILQPHVDRARRRDGVVGRGNAR